MRTTKQPSQEDVGGAMMAWYADALKRFPDGLVTQAQAAGMLRISRTAVTRLVTRGYLRAVYFPKEPKIGGIAVDEEAPWWLQVAGVVGRMLDEEGAWELPTACYVSFKDVTALWERSEAKAKCKIHWVEAFKAAARGEGLAEMEDRIRKAKAKRKAEGKGKS